MKKIVAVVVVAVFVAASPLDVWGSQKDVSPIVEATAFKQMAASIPLGSRVKVHTTAGRRLTATLLSVTDEAIVLKRESRVPEPAVSVRFDDLKALQRAERSGGLSVGKAIGIGLAAGAGAILTLFAIAFSISD